MKLNLTELKFDLRITGINYLWRQLWRETLSWASSCSPRCCCRPRFSRWGLCRWPGTTSSGTCPPPHDCWKRRGCREFLAENHKFWKGKEKRIKLENGTCHVFRKVRIFRTPRVTHSAAEPKHHSFVNFTGNVSTLIDDQWSVTMLSNFVHVHINPWCKDCHMA